MAHDYEHLFRIYAPLYEKEEEERTSSWQTFLTCAAAQLGIERAGGADAVALAAAVLPRLLKESGAPLLTQLSKLVHSGVPAALRPTIWPLLLRAKRVAPDGHYEGLLKVVEAGG